MSIARPTVRIPLTPYINSNKPYFTQSKLPPGANRILFVKNLNYNITGDDLYDLFGRYGSIRQIRIGNEQKSKGTAFVVFDDVMDVGNPVTASSPLVNFHWTGQKCSWPPEWFPFARAVYCCSVPYARQTRCSCRKGWFSEERGGTRPTQEETWYWRWLSSGLCVWCIFYCLQFWPLVLSRRYHRLNPSNFLTL